MTVELDSDVCHCGHNIHEHEAVYDCKCYVFGCTCSGFESKEQTEDCDCHEDSMTAYVWRHTVTDLKTGEKHIFTGGIQAKNEAQTKFNELFDTGADWEYEKICPECKRKVE